MGNDTCVDSGGLPTAGVPTVFCTVFARLSGFTRESGGIQAAISRTGARRALAAFIALLVTMQPGEKAYAYELESISQGNANVSYSLPVGATLGQSFTATDSGHITHIGISSNGGTFDLKIFEGTGNTGTQLYSENGVFFGNTSLGASDVHPLNQKIDVAATQTYTFTLTNVSSDNRGIHTINNGTDLYDGGRRLTFGGPDDDPLADLAFIVRFATDLEVSGTNGILIIDGDSTPATGDGSDFGSAIALSDESVTRTFRITNDSDQPVIIGGVSLVLGEHFSFVSEPAASLAPGASSNFQVKFDPTAVGSFTDAVGVFSTGAPNPYNFIVSGVGDPDVTNPSPIITGPGSRQNAPFTVTIDFGETVTGFTLGDLVVGNGSAAGLVDLGNGRFTASVTPATDGTVTVDLPAGRANDLSGNPNDAASRFSVVADFTSPTPVITGPLNVQNDEFFVTIDFGEPVTGFTRHDVAASNANVSMAAVTSLGGGAYSVKIIPFTTAIVTVDVAADAAQDTAGNTSNAASPFSVAADFTPPAARISGPAAPQNGDFPIIIDFREPVIGFTLSDISVSRGIASGLVDTGGGTFSATVTPTSDGTITVQVPSDSLTDLVGNSNINGFQFRYTVTADLTAPVPTLGGPVDLQAGAFTVTIGFGEPVVDFVVSDLTVGNGTASDLLDNGGGSFSATITPLSDGAVTVALDADMAADIAGNGNLAAGPFETTADITAPAPSISGPSAPQSESFVISIDFGETISGFALQHLAVGNGVASSFVDDGGGSYSATITPLSDGIITVDIAADVAQDAASNGNEPAEQFSVTADLTAPTPLITGPATVQNGPFSVTIAFAEDMTGFAVDDLAVSNGAASDLVDIDGGSFSATITPASSGQVTVDVSADVATDIAGNANEAAAGFSVVADLSAPAPVISGPATPQNAPFAVTVAFGEAIDGFTLEDLAVGNGVASDLADSGGGNYAATISPSAAGDVTVDIGAGVATDAAGNPNVAATQFRGTADLDPPRPVISGPATTTYQPFTVVIDFGEPVSNFDLNDITVGGGAKSAFIDQGGGSFSATVSPTIADSVVTVSVNAGLASDLAGNPNSDAVTLRVIVLSGADGTIDLQIDKTNGEATVIDGGITIYTISVFNAGPSDAADVVVSDVLPPGLVNAQWTCQPLGAASCSASGTGNVDDLAVIPAGDAVVYQLMATIDSVGSEQLTNTAIVVPPSSLSELNLLDNSSSDTSQIGLFKNGFE